MPVNKTPNSKSRKSFSMEDVSEAVTFTVDKDEFEAIPANRLPAGSLAKYFAFIDASNLFEAQEYFFSAILTEESYELFESRMNSTDRPITISLLGEIAAWLLGDVYLQGDTPDEEDSK